jgi:hypothetical protein
MMAPNMPAIVLPLHDPEMQLFPHLKAILPDLKILFRQAYICPTFETRRHDGLMDWLAKEAFFTIFPLEKQMQIGELFAHLYLNAARAADPDEIIHLAYVDRLCFALQGQYRDQFLADVKSIGDADIPLILQRSDKAWRTHPKNYHEIESFVTTIGKILFGKPLDYAWCHIVVKAARLAEILPQVNNHDLSMVAEMVLLLQPDIKTKEVDWLAWEDPFILGRDPEMLKHERENSPEETQKRLSYAIPMVEAMLKFALMQKNQ